MPENTSIGTLVPQNELPVFLPRVVPWLDRTLRESEMGAHWTLEEVIDDLQTGSLQLWAAYEGGKYLFVITQIARDRIGVVVEIVLGGGELDAEKAVVNQISLIENWAMRCLGAKSLVVWGRLGWLRLLRKHGYHFETAKYRRIFNDRMQ